MTVSTFYLLNNVLLLLVALLAASLLMQWHEFWTLLAEALRASRPGQVVLAFRHWLGEWRHLVAFLRDEEFRHLFRTARHVNSYKTAPTMQDLLRVCARLRHR